MKTTQEVVKGKAYIWAVPKSEYALKREVEENDGVMEGICPFSYDVTDSDSDWRNNTVLVHEFDIAGIVPAGIDLVLKAVETLRDKITKIQAEADKEVEKLEEQIRHLALIEFKPSIVVDVKPEPIEVGTQDDTRF